MTCNDVMAIIYKEYPSIATELDSYIASKDKPNFIRFIMSKTNCDELIAKTVCNYFIDGTPLPSTLTPAEIARNRQEAQDLLNKPKCPTCNSTNIKKISTTSKVVNTAVFGLFGTKRHKTFHCNNCGYEW